MKEVQRIGCALVLLGFAVFGMSSAHAESNGLSAEQIITKAIERAKESASQARSVPYSFTQISVREELDAKGCVKERKQASDQVCSDTGSFLKSTRKGNTKPTGEADSLKLSKYKCSNRSEAINLLTPDLLARYTFSLVSQSHVDGRQAYEIAFQPKSGNLPGKEFAEKVLNRACGRLWIDATEFELAKAHIQINSEINVGGGILGSLKRAMVVLERIRLDGGVWFDRFYKTDYEARKLAQSKRVITCVEAHGFRKASQG